MLLSTPGDDNMRLEIPRKKRIHRGIHRGRNATVTKVVNRNSITGCFVVLLPFDGKGEVSGG